MDIAQVSIIHHTALILGLLWLLTYLGWAHPVAFFVSLLYLYKVNERYSLRLRRRLQFEERKYANQRKLLSDTESVRWLNHAVEKIWPICMEKIASQLFLMPVIPWFLEKYKPWTAKEVVVQHLYLGRKPPVFTEIRVLGESADDDHLVLELGMSFLSADDMSIILAVKPRLGLGIWANMHLTGMHVEGKVLVGVKFLRQWPFLGRMRVCFVEPPYFQMTVKPIFNHGVDVTELPGIAGWLDNMLAVAFEQTLVEPNMLVVDVEKFASSPAENWFTVDEKAPIAYAKVEIIEAADLKPSDLNGLADPYVKGHLGTYRFRTKIQKKTLNPKWLEDFKIPIATWEGPNLLVLELRDKDHIFDDMLGDCAININEFRSGQRQDKWLPLLNIKKGRVHVAITVFEGEDDKGKEQKSEYKGVHQDSNNEDVSDGAQMISPRLNPKVQNQNSKAEESHQMVDQYEPIDVEGQEKTGLWVHRPGSEVSQSWEPRRGRARHPETKVQRESNEFFEGADSPISARSGSQPSDSNNNDKDGKRVRRLNTIKKGLHKIGSMFHSSSKDESPRRDGDDFVIPSPRPNIHATGEKRTPVRVIYDDIGIVASDDEKLNSDTRSPEKDEGENSKREHAKGIAKSIMKQAGKSAHSLKNVLSRKGSFGLSEEQMSEMEMKEASEGSDSATALKGAYSPAAQDEEFSDAKEGDVRQRKDEEKSVRFRENTVARNSQTS